MTGHQTSKEVDRYTKAASQKRMAEAGMPKRVGNKIVPVLLTQTVTPEHFHTVLFENGEDGAQGRE